MELVGRRVLVLGADGRSPKCRCEYDTAAAPSRYTCFCGKVEGVWRMRLARYCA